jgi:chemotaxis protein methyltransferase CheR
MSPTFPFSHGFHVIFCRNVMIYFDRPTQKTLVNKLSGQLRPGGCLIIGHSESLNGIDHPLSYVEPTVYQKK